MEQAQTLKSIADHPKVMVSHEDLKRIEENRKIYAGDFSPIKYRVDNGQQMSRPKKFVNTPKIFANHLVTLLLNDGVEIKCDNEQADDFLRETLLRNNFLESLSEELEAGYAINGLALRPYVENEQVKFSFCPAGTFFPISASGNVIDEAVIINKEMEKAEGKTYYYTLMEFHEWEDGDYVITHELYRSSRAGEPGEKVPLSDRYPDLEERIAIQGLSGPLFTYIKLAGKNNVTDTPLGLGIVDNAKTQIADINDKYDMFMFEVEKSATIITASHEYFKTRFDEKGKPIQIFDDKSARFQKVNAGLDGDMGLEEFAPSLRSEEFIDTINFILQITEISLGFNSGTFIFQGAQGIKTATEVVSENSKTYQTRGKNAKLLADALVRLFKAAFEVAQIGGIYNGSLDFEISVHFDDGVFNDKNTSVDFYDKAVRGGLISKKRAMMRLFKLTEEQADEQIAEMVRESRMFDIEFGATQQHIAMFGREENR